MANLTEVVQFDAGVYQLETTDPVQGGANGVSNAPLKNLANRTAYLKKHINDLESGVFIPSAVATLASPAFTGSPTAPTQSLGNNTTRIATTAFVQGTVGGRLAKSVAGGVNVTLTAVEAGNAILEFTGALTANIAVIVPTSPTAQWIVKNSTSGAFTLTVKTAAGSGVVVTQGKTEAVYTDGTNVLVCHDDYADIALTGVPTAPTATTGTNTTQVASTAFVIAQVASSVPSASETVAGRVELATAAETTTGTDSTRAVHPAGLKVELDKKANIASPAFTGVPTAPTAAQFDNDTSLATTEFVQRALGSFSGAVGYSTATATLTAADVGKHIVVSVASTLTLPSASSVSLGATLFISATGGGDVTLSRAGADTIIRNDQISGNTFVVKSGTSVRLRQGNGGTGWYVIEGDGALPYSSLFGSSLATSGYQKLPSGLIIQWGNVTTSASADVQVTYPIAFPNVAASISLTADVSTAGAFADTNTGLSTGFRAAAWSSTSARVSAYCRWIAIGY